MEFSRQEYWSGWPIPSPGDLPTEGSNPGLPHCRRILYQLSHKGSLGEGVAQMVKNLPPMQETGVPPWVGKIPWRRKWQSTPVFLPGEFHGLRSLEGYRPWCCRVRHDRNSLAHMRTIQKLYNTKTVHHSNLQPLKWVTEDYFCLVFKKCRSGFP